MVSPGDPSWGQGSARAGSIAAAMASSRDGTTEYVTVGVDAPVYATGVEVHETYGGGFVSRVDVVDTDDVLHTVWTGTDPGPANQASTFRITWPETDYLVDGVRIYVDTDASPTGLGAVVYPIDQEPSTATREEAAPC